MNEKQLATGSYDSSGNKTNWKWKPKRWWIGLIVFWFISTLGAGILVRAGCYPGFEDGFIILTMLIFVTFAVCFDKSWGIPMRIIWVIGVWFIHAFLTIPMGFLAAIIMGTQSRLLDRAAALFAAIPIIVWSMHRSKFFVEAYRKKDG